MDLKKLSNKIKLITVLIIVLLLTTIGYFVFDNFKSSADVQKVNLTGFIYDGKRPVKNLAVVISGKTIIGMPVTNSIGIFSQKNIPIGYIKVESLDSRCKFSYSLNMTKNTNKRFYCGKNEIENPVVQTTIPVKPTVTAPTSTNQTTTSTTPTAETGTANSTLIATVSKSNSPYQLGSGKYRLETVSTNEKNSFYFKTTKEGKDVEEGGYIKNVGEGETELTCTQKDSADLTKRLYPGIKHSFPESTSSYATSLNIIIDNCFNRTLTPEGSSDTLIQVSEYKKTVQEKIEFYKLYNPTLTVKTGSVRLYEIK